MTEDNLTAEERDYLAWEQANMHFVVEMTHVGPYTLHLVFDDGAEKTINFYAFVSDPKAGAQYNLMQELEYFNQVALIDGHLTWPNRWDFNPAMLYTWEGDSWKEWIKG